MHCVLVPSVQGSIFSNRNTQIPNRNMTQFQTKAKQLSLFLSGLAIWVHFEDQPKFFLTQVKGVGTQPSSERRKGEGTLG